MRKWIIAVSVSAGLIFLSILWAPWITDDYAINRVVEILGGSEARFNYLGEDMAIKDIPKEVSWFPFGRYVTFPGEAGWLVNFYGAVSQSGKGRSKRVLILLITLLLQVKKGSFEGDISTRKEYNFPPVHG